MENFFESLYADRIGGANFGKDTEIYKFEKIKRAKAEAKRKFPDVPFIDMGVGEPDCGADASIVRVLAEEASKSENRFYADNGILEFQQAACDYMKNIYGVEGLIPEKNVVHGIGSKPILAMIPECVINPGDIALMTVPGYGVLGTHTRYLGGSTYNLPLIAENSFLPDLDSIPKDILSKAKLLYINYPNNPTGATATPEFFRDVVEFAKKNHIMVVHDAAYAAVTMDDYKPLSFLSVDGAMDVGIEIHSMSKAFNMTGWRMAFAAGNENIIKAYATVKDNTDSGQFRAIQKACVYALNHTELTDAICRKYSRRFDLLVNALNEVGFNASKPNGSFYCYVKAPIGAGDVQFSSAEEATEFIIKHAQISTVPWDDAGAYLRMSVTFEATDESEEIAVVEDMKSRLNKLDLKFK